MTQEIRKRYEDALETLRSIVARTGEARDQIQALIRSAASEMLDALERDPGADLDGIIDAFRAAVEAIVTENMRLAAKAADDEGEESIADIPLALTFLRVDISAPVQKYATALSQEVKWFVAGGFAYGAIRDYLKDPQGFLASESMKPQQKKIARQTEGRTSLAPVFMDGKRRRSISEVLEDFRDSVPSVGTGNSYEVGRNTWMLLNYSSMRAYNDALTMKFNNGGAIGFYVFRTTGYDCPICDEQCGYLHQLSSETPPYHPNCCCAMVPAYIGEVQSDFEI